MYVRWTFHVSRGMVSTTASGQKGPVTCAVLTTHRAMEASSMPPLNRRVERGAGTGAQSHAADCSSPGRGELTRTLPDPDGGSCRRGDRPRIPTLLYVLQR